MEITVIVRCSWLVVWGILLMGGDGLKALGAEITFRINSETFEKDLGQLPRQTLRARDPNFPLDPIQTYTGVDLKTLLNAETEAIDQLTMITVIARDKYIYYGNLQETIAEGALFVDQVRGKPLAISRGGPVTLMFPLGSPREQFVWYVELVSVGELKDPTLLIAHGKKNVLVNREQLLEKAKTVSLDLPVPRGIREGLKTFQGARTCQMVPLKELGIDPRRPFKATDIIGNNQDFGSSGEWFVVAGCENRPMALNEGGPYLLLELDKSAISQVFYFLQSVES